LQVKEDSAGNVKIASSNAGKDFAAEEISAQVLRKLTEDAAKFLNDKVSPPHTFRTILEEFSWSFFWRSTSLFLRVTIKVDDVFTVDSPESEHLPVPRKLVTMRTCTKSGKEVGCMTARQSPHESITEELSLRIPTLRTVDCSPNAIDCLSSLERVCLYMDAPWMGKTGGAGGGGVNAKAMLKGERRVCVCVCVGGGGGGNEKTYGLD
jgi:hypothetical protein